MARARRSNGGTLDAIEISAVMVLVLYGVFYLNSFFESRLNVLGILPRTLWGLLGVIFSPLLHYSAAHLAANAVSLFILLIILFSHREYHPRQTLLLIWVLSGVGTWVIGRPAIHIGASSILYGIVVYLVAAAWWMRTWRTAIVGSLILFLYGGIFYGMLPQRGIVSWEGHLSGAIAGWWVARRHHR